MQKNVKNCKELQQDATVTLTNTLQTADKQGIFPKLGFCTTWHVVQICQREKQGAAMTTVEK